MTYTLLMVIIETSVFTKHILGLMSDDSYRELQQALCIRPDLGDIIPGCEGLRKVRWQLPGRGKRGGARIIYYWQVSANQIYMLYVYAKNEHDNLTPGQLSQLQRVVKEEFGDG